MMNVDPVLPGYGFLFYPASFVHGFTKPPTDYYFRPWHNYFILKPHKGKSRTRFCRGNMVDHEVVLNLTQQWFEHHGQTCHFSITLALHDYTHDVPSDVQRLDKPLRSLLEHLESTRALENTVLLIIGDHGHRLSVVKHRFQGQLEERIAFFSIYFPPWFREKFPESWRNLKENTKQVVTHYDLHETLKDIQRGKLEVSQQQQSSWGRGISLFGKIPENRTCADTDTQIQFCPCLVPNDSANLTKEITDSVKQVLIHWLIQSKYCPFCKTEDCRILYMAAYTSNEFVRRSIRHFDKNAAESLKTPPKDLVDFLWTVAETRIGRTVFRITGVVQHSKAKGQFKLNSSPDVEEQSVA